jgi:hypothetical protein
MKYALEMTSGIIIRIAKFYESSKRFKSVRDTLTNSKVIQ